MLEKHANFNTVDCYGETALHLAAVQGFIDIVKLLLERAEIDINIENTLACC